MGQVTSGDSLDHQKKITNLEATKRNIEILFDFEDAFSGRKISRTGYDELLNYIKTTNQTCKDKFIKYVFIKCIDRFTRGGTEFYIQMKNDLENK